MQEFINRQIFHLTLFTLIFGVIFYDIIHLMGFDYVDEICAVLLFVLFTFKVFQSKTWAFNRAFLILLGIFLFYLIYSLAIHSNTKAAILTDFVIQLKPYLSFFCIYALRPKFNDNQKKIIRQIIFLCAIFVFIIGVGWIFYYGIIEYTFVHPSRLATASTILAFLYLYCSDYTKSDKIIFILLLSIGILSGRSKHYGFFAICFFMILILTGSFQMKLNVKNSVFLVLGLALMLFMARNKIYLYFVQGGFGSGRDVQNLYARMALYFFSTKILLDYIPFGSGFGSYATFASAEYYSPIYAKYGMENMHGLSKASPDFIADTYFPALAQFGIVGVVLFFSFWINLAVKAAISYNKDCKKEAYMVLVTVIFFMIECTSDSTITHNRGMFMMMILGMLMSDIKHKTEHPEIIENHENTVS